MLQYGERLSVHRSQAWLAFITYEVACTRFVSTHASLGSGAELADIGGVEGRRAKVEGRRSKGEGRRAKVEGRVKGDCVVCSQAGSIRELT